MRRRFLFESRKQIKNVTLVNPEDLRNALKIKNFKIKFLEYKTNVKL